MTLASSLIVIHPRATCREAEWLARHHQVAHLLVVDGLSLVGILSSDALGRDGRVADRMNREIFAVLGEATLGEAVAAMIAFDLGMLPVIGERFVIGALTRTDLIRMGVPPSVFRPPPRTLSEARQLDEDLEERPTPIDDDSDLIPLCEDTRP
jgi:predicted transcriptional regulator